MIWVNRTELYTMVSENEGSGWQGGEGGQQRPRDVTPNSCWCCILTDLAKKKLARDRISTQCTYNLEISLKFRFERISQRMFSECRNNVTFPRHSHPLKCRVSRSVGLDLGCSGILSVEDAQLAWMTEGEKVRDTLLTFEHHSYQRLLPRQSSKLKDETYRISQCSFVDTVVLLVLSSCHYCTERMPRINLRCLCLC